MAFPPCVKRFKILNYILYKIGTLPKSTGSSVPDLRPCIKAVFKASFSRGDDDSHR